jgi:hypothetical protein
MNFNSKTKSKTITKSDIAKIEEKKKEKEVDKTVKPNEAAIFNSLMSENLGYTFDIPFFSKPASDIYLTSEIFLKAIILQPVPPEVGKLHFTIVRNNSVFKIAPTYTLYLEKNHDQKFQILYAKKMIKGKTSYYMITLERQYGTDPKRSSGNCIGKLRSIDNKKNKFMLYDNGENFSAKNIQFRDLRTEHGIFTFRYDPSYDGNIRKMYIVLPAIKKVVY